MTLLRSTFLINTAQDEALLRESIATCGADLVCLDLEDTVHPSKKAQARQLIARLLHDDGLWGRSARGVRLNAVSTPHAHADITELVRAAGDRIDLFVCSKVESPEHVWWVDHLITQTAQAHQVQEHIRLLLGIETAGALTDIDRIATASPRNAALGFAIGDLSISLGIPVGSFLKDRSLYPGDPFHFIRSRINLAAKTAGLQAIDGPWPILNELDVLAEDARWGVMLGMNGKLALSEEQVPVIHRAYRPSEAEIAYARRMLASFEQVLAAGDGSGVLDGEFMDPVTLGVCQAILARAEAPV